MQTRDRTAVTVRLLLCCYRFRLLSNVVRFEIIRRFVRLVEDRKFEVRSLIRKIPFEGKIITSHIFIYT
jgi:hypothetical protein